MTSPLTILLLLYYTKQMGLILLWICLVLVTKDTKLWLEHLTHLAAPSIQLFCSYSILVLSAIYF